MPPPITPPSSCPRTPRALEALLFASASAAKHRFLTPGEIVPLFGASCPAALSSPISVCHKGTSHPHLSVLVPRRRDASS
eukprot:scaffold526652_cov36-Prasinocladus_malaysianus.AAC.1